MKLDMYSQEIQNYIREVNDRAQTAGSLIFESVGNRQVALSYYYTYHQYAELSGDNYLHAVADFNIAYILTRMKRYTDAKEHYYCAIEHFEKSEDAVSREQNLIQCMVYCGLCHLLLEESKEALALMERIQQIRQEHPDCKYSELCLLAFEAGCEQMKGNKDLARELADRLETAVFRDENLAEVQEIIVILADLMVKLKYYRRVDRVMELLDEKNIENNASVYLDLYPFKSRYLLNNNRMEEYIAYTKRYLALYRKHQHDNRAVTARILELQEKLSSVELERRDIQVFNRNLESIALYDALTGLANRAYLNDYLSQVFEEALAKQTPIGVELMDIDFFKEYNDTYGHLAGDACIEAVANVLSEAEGENVFCARYGGDEFMIVYSNMTAAEIRNVVRTIQEKVRALHINHEGSQCADIVTVSQGVFVKVPEEQNREWDFNSMADIALYEAKREGRNRYHIATDFVE